MGERPIHRGTYDAADHKYSNDFGLEVAAMFHRNYGARITKCVVNDDLVGTYSFFVKDDMKWDLELTLPENSEFFKHKLSRGKRNLCIEVEIKKLYVDTFNINDIWPRRFKTVHFGWAKYRVPGDHSKYKPYVLETAERDDVDILHFIGLHYVDKGKHINGYRYSWAMHLKDILKCEIETKMTKRGHMENFYSASPSEKRLLFDFHSGEPIILK